MAHILECIAINDEAAVLVAAKSLRIRNARRVIRGGSIIRMASLPDGYPVIGVVFAVVVDVDRDTFCVWNCSNNNGRFGVAWLL